MADDYYTKLTPMMGSQDWPDIIWSDPENSGGAFQNWSDPRQEMLYNLDDLLTGNAERYPYLTKLIYSDQYKNIIYHEGHYIVPAVQTSTAWAIYYRADWLEQIGFVDESGNAKAPVTLDEFEYVMSRFPVRGSLPTPTARRRGRRTAFHPIRRISTSIRCMAHSVSRPTGTLRKRVTSPICTPGRSSNRISNG